MEEWNVCQWTRQTATEIILPFSVGVWQQGFESQQYQKTGRYIAWHGYQSFKPNEVTPEQCHEIGLKLAGEMWGDKYQIIVATHLDKGHLHNHCGTPIRIVRKAETD